MPNRDAAWLPGTEGAGVAEVLFGDYDFTGRLPHSWPANIGQIPINVGDSSYNPLFAYGYGLDYSSFPPSVTIANPADGATLPAPLISGKDLLAAGFRPGPGLGIALRQVRLLQLRDELGDAASALAWLRGR